MHVLHCCFSLPQTKFHGVEKSLIGSGCPRKRTFADGGNSLARCFHAAVLADDDMQHNRAASATVETKADINFAGV
jgi:hypothetical protein